jgi:hypothetical protein
VATRVADERRTAVAIANVDQEHAALVIGRNAVLDDLRDPAALKRAFVLREVLGPPVALR